MRTLLTLILAALAAMCQPAQASCIAGPWVSTDKDLHAVGNAAVVFATDSAVRELAPRAFEVAPYLGLLPALAISAYREHYKTTHGGRCEYASMTYDAAGMAIGAAGTHWLLMPQVHGVQIAYAREF